MPDILKLTPYDRIVIDGVAHKAVRWLDGAEVLETVPLGTSSEVQHRFLAHADRRALARRRALRVDVNFYSRSLSHMSDRGDCTDLTDLSEDQRLTVVWKLEWCTRFLDAHLGRTGGFAPNRTPEDFGAYIEAEREAIHRWYVETFNRPRPAGRRFTGMRRKLYDYPSDTTLRGWLKLFEATGNTAEGLKPHYENCGNRHQMDPRVVTFVKTRTLGYASAGQPDITTVYKNIETDISDLNARLSPECQAYVSRKAVRKRVRKLWPMYVDAGRMRQDKALRKYMPVGEGFVTVDGLSPIERMDVVEIDDWEFDLFTIIEEGNAAGAFTPEALTKAIEFKKGRATVRLTATVAIDVETRCVLAVHTTPFRPSTPGSVSALRGMLADKTRLAALCGCASDWPMHGMPGEVSTDGGPAFKGDFAAAVRKLGLERRQAGADPRMRGHVESFFQRFMGLCQLFTGQSFSNVVKKGDYPAEQAASMMADDFRKLLVRFIVDDYHHSKNDGLPDLTPYRAWRQAKNPLNPSVDELQRFVAFGVPLDGRTIDKSGITFLRLQYIHPSMGILHGAVGRRRLGIIFDPHDLGSILVRLPKDLREHFKERGSYLRFTAAGMDGVSVDEHMRNNAEILRNAREAYAEGLPYRIGAHKAFLAASEAALRRAGMPSDELTAKEWEMFITAIERGGARLVQPRTVPSGPPMSLDAGPDALGSSLDGTVPAVAAAPTVGPDHSRFAKSINLLMDEEDEE